MLRAPPLPPLSELRPRDPSYEGLVKIISGGQTGADRAGLEAAKHLGLKTGGFAPHGYMTEDGPKPDLGTEYGLEEMPKTTFQQMYPARSRKNVDESDGTVAFRLYASVGTDKTIGYCRTGEWRYYTRSVSDPHRPVLIVTSFSQAQNDRFRRWMVDKRISVLNVAGHREGSVLIGDFQKKVFDFLVSALS
jgi:hypothetical protein